MPKIRYQEKRFGAATLEVIEAAVGIIDEYAGQGFTLTLRQLYYQFVARDLLENSQRSYKRLGSIVNDARMAGLIDWAAIEDRTRELESPPHWSGPSEIVEDCVDAYRVDMWEFQQYRPEVWIEKQALVGIIEGVCSELGVPYFACRGYVSQSEQWLAGRRHAEHLRRGQTPVVFHLGDHDPSGIDMTRDNADRLELFARSSVSVRRLALNMDQVAEYGPPPNPAKVTDSRFAGYVAEHGESSWELDALEPAVLVALIRSNVRRLTDVDEWEAAEARCEAGRERLAAIVEELAEADE